MKAWALLLLVVSAAAAPIQFQGEPRELAVSKISDRAKNVKFDGAKVEVAL